MKVDEFLLNFQFVSKAFVSGALFQDENYICKAELKRCRVECTLITTLWLVSISVNGKCCEDR